MRLNELYIIYLSKYSKYIIIYKYKHSKLGLVLIIISHQIYDMGQILTKFTIVRINILESKNSSFAIVDYVELRDKLYFFS